MASPHPLPTRIRLLQGMVPKPTISIEPGIPDCPGSLDGVGRAKYFELASHLSKMGILSLADKTYLELVCLTYSEYRHAVKQAKSTTALLDTPASAHQKVAASARATLIALLREGGLTPASRSKLQATETSSTDPIDEFLN